MELNFTDLMDILDGDAVCSARPTTLHHAASAPGAVGGEELKHGEAHGWTRVLVSVSGASKQDLSTGGASLGMSSAYKAAMAQSPGMPQIDDLHISSQHPSSDGRDSGASGNIAAQLQPSSGTQQQHAPQPVSSSDQHSTGTTQLGGSARAAAQGSAQDASAGSPAPQGQSNPSTSGAGTNSGTGPRQLAGSGANVAAAAGLGSTDQLDTLHLQMPPSPVLHGVDMEELLLMNELGSPTAVAAPTGAQNPVSGGLAPHSHHHYPQQPSAGGPTDALRGPGMDTPFALHNVAAAKGVHQEQQQQQHQQQGHPSSARAPGHPEFFAAHPHPHSLSIFPGPSPSAHHSPAYPQHNPYWAHTQAPPGARHHPGMPPAPRTSTSSLPHTPQDGPCSPVGPSHQHSMPQPPMPPHLPHSSAFYAASHLPLPPGSPSQPHSHPPGPGRSHLPWPYPSPHRLSRSQLPTDPDATPCHTSQLPPSIPEEEPAGSGRTSMGGAPAKHARTSYTGMAVGGFGERSVSSPGCHLPQDAGTAGSMGYVQAPQWASPQPMHRRSSHSSAAHGGAEVVMQGQYEHHPYPGQQEAGMMPRAPSGMMPSQGMLPGPPNAGSPHRYGPYPSSGMPPRPTSHTHLPSHSHGAPVSHHATRANSTTSLPAYPPHPAHPHLQTMGSAGQIPLAHNMSVPADPQYGGAHGLAQSSGSIGHMPTAPGSDHPPMDSSMARAKLAPTMSAPLPARSAHQPPSRAVRPAAEIDPDRPDEGWMASHICYKRFTADTAPVQLPRSLLSALSVDLQRIHQGLVAKRMARGPSQSQPAASHPGSTMTASGLGGAPSVAGPLLPVPEGGLPPAAPAALSYDSTPAEPGGMHGDVGAGLGPRGVTALGSAGSMPYPHASNGEDTSVWAGAAPSSAPQQGLKRSREGDVRAPLAAARSLF